MSEPQATSRTTRRSFVIGAFTLLLSFRLSHSSFAAPPNSNIIVATDRFGGTHGNDRSFEGKAKRAYLKDHGTPFPEMATRVIGNFKSNIRPTRRARGTRKLVVNTRVLLALPTLSGFLGVDVLELAARLSDAAAVTAKSLQTDKGIRVRPEHIHESLRELAGIADHPLSRKFPLGLADKEKLTAFWG